MEILNEEDLVRTQALPLTPCATESNDLTSLSLCPCLEDGMEL